MISIQIVSAQKFTVTGTILSNEDQLPIIGASVLEKTTQNGTITNADGIFKLELNSSSAILVVTYIGMESIEVNVAGLSTLKILMSTNKSILDEVVVTGYKKEIRSEVSTAIASIKSKDIEKLVVQSVEQALQGQAPGVMVTQATGAPGDDIAVRIRGAGTLGNNNPLYVIDGMLITSDNAQTSAGGIAGSSLNGLSSINPGVMKSGLIKADQLTCSFSAFIDRHSSAAKSGG